MKISILALTALLIPGLLFTKEGKMENINIKTETATVAGGCFWCVESDFKKIDGVIEVVSGYTGGKMENPSYEDVSRGSTGHLEAVQVLFDPVKITYGQILDIFWRHMDPTDAGGQFADRGSQYRSAVFYHNEKQKEIAMESKMRLEK